MAWWTKSGWKRSWGTRAWRKKQARVASRHEDQQIRLATCVLCGQTFSRPGHHTGCVDDPAGIGPRSIP